MYFLAAWRGGRVERVDLERLNVIGLRLVHEIISGAVEYNVGPVGGPVFRHSVEIRNIQAGITEIPAGPLEAARESGGELPGCAGFGYCRSRGIS